MDYSKTNPQALIKLRFKELREEIKAEDGNLKEFTEMVVKLEDCYNNPDGWEKIKNFWYLKYADLKLLEIATVYFNDIRTERHY